MPNGLSALSGRNVQRNYGYSPGTSGYGYLSRGGYGYSDTYGARVLPGGYLAASPSNTGQARKIYGVDFPVVDYPGTGYDPTYPLTGAYADTLGVGAASRIANLPSSPDVTYPPAMGRIPGGIDITGDMNPGSALDLSGNPMTADIGPGAYRSYTNRGTTGPPAGGYPIPGGGVSSTAPAATSNAPGALQFLSRINPLFGLIGGAMGGTSSTSSNAAPDWVQNAQSGYGFAGRIRGGIRNAYDWLTGQSPNYPDLSVLSSTVFDAAGYPIPGGGDPRNAAGDWRQNASRSSYANLGGFGGDRGGFGGGLASLGGGGWQTTSEFPSFSGFGAPVGRSSAGPLAP